MIEITNSKYPAWKMLEEIFVYFVLNIAVNILYSSIFDDHFTCNQESQYISLLKNKTPQI